MATSNNEFHFEDLIIKSLTERKDLIGSDEVTNTMVKFLVEIRESARKNENYKAYDHITQEIETKLGISLKEETRIIAVKN